MFNADLKSQARSILQQGCQKFSLSQGLVSHICHDIYEVVAIYPTNENISEGDSLSLEDTYCREVVVTGRTVAITELDGIGGMQNHPLYQSMPIEAYISAPIIVKNEIWGTLNFSDLQIRDIPFVQEDFDWIKAKASLLANMIVEEVG